MIFVYRFVRYGLVCYDFDNDENIVFEKRIINFCVFQEKLEFNG